VRGVANPRSRICAVVPCCLYWAWHDNSAHVNVTYLTDEDYQQIVEQRGRAKRASSTTQQQQQP